MKDTNLNSLQGLHDLVKTLSRNNLFTLFHLLAFRGKLAGIDLELAMQTRLASNWQSSASVSLALLLLSLLQDAWNYISLIQSCRRYRSPCAHREAPGKPGMLNTQGCLFDSELYKFGGGSG